jgi:hypothetical protein
MRLAPVSDQLGGQTQEELQALKNVTELSNKNAQGIVDLEKNFLYT